MKNDDFTYFRRRIAEEEAEALKAQRPEVRQVHRQLANLYKARLRTLGSPQH